MKMLFLPLLLLIPFALMAQTAQNPFYDYYDVYRQEGLEERRFQHADILPMIRSLKVHPVFTITKAGESVQGRDIYLLKVGKGEKRVLLWSQMHGDEPTATMALFDIFNFFKAPHQLTSIRQELLEELTIYFIPMLNPDGAEVYQRHNAQGIDINRDYLQLDSPEARLLKSVQDSLKPHWGFNLHDQNTLNSVGKSGKPATISFLAPTYDEARSANAVRKRAMRLIVELNESLQPFIPGQVARFSDEYESRAFGDNFQKAGIHAVLIESGGYQDDPEKQYIRKLNFVAILQGLLSIARESYVHKDIERYEEIPENQRYLFDLLIRHAQVEMHGNFHEVDIAINRAERELEGSQRFFYQSSIEDMGDLSAYSGYEELDASGMQAIPGKVYQQPFDDIESLKKADFHQLIQSGYTTVKLKNMPSENYTSLPLNIIPEQNPKEPVIANGTRPNFVLQKDGEVRYAIINGFVFNLLSDKNKIKNALVGDH